MNCVGKNIRGKDLFSSVRERNNFFGEDYLLIRGKFINSWERIHK